MNTDTYRESRWRRTLRGSSLFLGLAAILIAGCLLEPSFIKLENQRDVLQRVSVNGMLAVGMTLVILTAGIDLSVGSLLSLCSVLCAMMVMGRQWNRGNMLAVACAAGGAFYFVLSASRHALRSRVENVPLRTVLCTVLAGAVAAAMLWWGAREVRHGFGVMATLVFVPAVGAVLGSFSGLVIAKGRLQPFIVTLAMMVLAVGLAKYVAGKGGQIHAIYVQSQEERANEDGLQRLHRQLESEGKGYASEGFAALGRNVLGVQAWNERLEQYETVRLIPVPGLFFLGSVLLSYIVLTRLPFGRYVYAVGGNEETARLSGINTQAVKIKVYAVSGMMAGLAAVLYCAMYGQGKSDAGQMGELDAIAAVVIGGTSLMGGKGRIAGTLVGVLIFGYLGNILVLRGISSEVQDIVKGVIIVLAVLLQEGRIVQWARQAGMSFVASVKSSMKTDETGNGGR